MRKLDRMLMGNLLPVSGGLSAQIARVSTFTETRPPFYYPFPFLCDLLYQEQPLPSLCWVKNFSTTTHDKIPNLSPRMCDSMLTVKDGPGVYRGQF